VRLKGACRRRRRCRCGTALLGLRAYGEGAGRIDGPCGAPRPWYGASDRRRVALVKNQGASGRDVRGKRVWTRAVCNLRVPGSVDAEAAGAQARRAAEDHVWFEDRWMVASLCDE
jgi:hypothetical protein